MDGQHTDRASGPKPSRWWTEAKWQAYLAIALSFVTVVMSTAMVFLLLSTIADDFGVTLRAVGWVVIIESLVISALLLPLGGLADGIGRRRMYLWGLFIFGVGAVCTGLAPTFAILIFARIFMSLGNAMVQAVGTGMLAAAFPPEEKGLAMGAQTTAVSVGAAAGPLLGGLAIQLAGWRALFVFLAVPVAISIVVGRAVLDEDPPAAVSLGRSGSGFGMSRSRFDGVGSLLAATIVIALVVTISNPFALPWLSPFIIGGFGTAVVALVAYVRWELGHDQPVLQLRLFRLPTFRAAVIVRLLGFIGSATTGLLLPIYLVSLRGFADGLAGVVLFFVAAGSGLGAQIAGRLSDRIGPRPPSLVGLALQGAVAIPLLMADQDTSLLYLTLLVLLSGLGISLWNVPNNGAMMGSVPVQNFAAVGAFTHVTRTMGNVIGQALVAAIVVGIMANRGFDVPLSEIADTNGASQAFLAGWRTAYAVTAGLAVITLVLALGLPAKPVTAAS